MSMRHKLTPWGQDSQKEPAPEAVAPNTAGGIEWCKVMPRHQQKMMPDDMLVFSFSE